MTEEGRFTTYKEGKKIKGTTALNYYAIIQDAYKINTFYNFKSLHQAKSYMMTHSNLTDEEIEIVVISL